MNVLYVEDEAFDSSSTRVELLRSFPDLHLDIVSTLAAARIHLAAVPRHDLVLVGMHLADGSGLELLKLIRERGLPLAVVIIAADEDAAVSALRAGADDYLTRRPDYLARLPQVIDSALRQRREHSARQSCPLRVLYLERDADDATATRDHFARFAPHLRLEVVRSAAQVLERLPASGQFADVDVLLCDLGLPGLSGLELLKEVRQYRSLDLPTLVVARRGDEMLGLQSLRLGAEECVVKSGEYLGRLPSIIESAWLRAQMRREQAALRESEQRFRAIFTTEPECVKILTADGRLSDMNPAGLAILGVSSLEQAQRRPLLDWLLPAYRDAFVQLHATVMQGGSGTLQFEILRADGARRWLETHATPMHDEAERVIALLGVTRDITEHRRANDDIRRLAAFPEQNPSPTFELGTNASVNYSNPAAKALARELGFAHPGEMLPPDTSDVIRDCLATGSSSPRIERQIGGRVLCWSFHPLCDQALVHCYADDVTERRRLEEQLLHSQKIEAIGHLAGGIAHDFNNVLTVVHGNAGLLASSRGMDVEQTTYVNDISLAVQRATGLTRQLLAFSRRETIQKRALDLHAVVTEMTSMLRRLLGDRVVILVESSIGLPSVVADLGMLEQVLMNLAVNARDAMPNGGRLEIRTQIEEVSDKQVLGFGQGMPGRFVTLSVSDTGTGIPPELMCRIFEPFFTTKEPGKGTGLGLATVERIVRQHGGWLRATSELGRGTTFTVFLPASAAMAPRPSANGPSAKGGTETILVVDDDSSVRTVARRSLQHLGYRVLEANSGDAALHLAANARIDLLLTDLIMPGGLNGRQLAKQLQTLRPGLGVVFTSGYAADVLGRDFLPNDGEEWLAKPYNLALLAQAVRRALDGSAKVSRL